LLCSADRWQETEQQSGGHGDGQGGARGDASMMGVHERYSLGYGAGKTGAKSTGSCWPAIVAGDTGSYSSTAT
jgi:hypothetical protein